MGFLLLPLPDMTNSLGKEAFHKFIAGACVDHEQSNKIWICVSLGDTLTFFHFYLKQKWQTHMYTERHLLPVIVSAVHHGHFLKWFRRTLLFKVWEALTTKDGWEESSLFLTVTSCFRVEESPLHKWVLFCMKDLENKEISFTQRT